MQVFLFSSCGAQAPGCMGSIVCGMWALVEVRELNSCGKWAQLPCSMWDLSSLTKDRTPCPLHCKADSLPLDHQGSPVFLYLK